MNLSYSILTSIALTSLVNAQITYKPDPSADNGKHLVFIASDHEYRAEETCPALARIMAKHHGFKCTVLFGVDQDGYIYPGASNIPGMEVLDSADGLFLFTRFLDLPDKQMEPFIKYLDNGGPIVSVRTSSHAFKIPAGKTYSKFSFRWKGNDFKNGFGQQYLGNTWEGHYGKNHVQGTQIQLVPDKLSHPILKGVHDKGFCYAGAYRGVIRSGMEVLANSQPLTSMDPKSTLDHDKPPTPFAWTFHYDTSNGKKNRVFHSTQGASQDILDPNYRRMLVNGMYWSLGMESKIKADSTIDFVGSYHPTTFRDISRIANYKKVKPEQLAGFDSTIGEP
ncbi:ThuA domain-containing protein [Rubritalea marina]|uniref:ThuA domain-containing protein n=1 Tax=Rubritalea marina TaxID=361055 RepID=UPI0003604753|nr:ThuA domain-containing protein [Rubritalea marina]